MKARNLQALLALIGGALTLDAHATIINILDIGDSGETADGTIFMAEPNPTEPSTGTGVFEPFLRIGSGQGSLCCEDDGGDGAQLGFNTEESEPDVNFDTKDGSDWTRSVLFGELGTIDGFYILSLDANQLGRGSSPQNRILLTDMQIYIGSDPNLADPEDSGLGTFGYTGTTFDSSVNGMVGLDPVWTLDGEDNGDVDILLQASICDSKGQCGSGHGDLDVLIPESLLSGLDTDFFVLYTEYSGANDGYEEWRFNSESDEVPPPPPPPMPVSEPATLTLLGTALLCLGFGAAGRRGRASRKK